MNKKKKKAHKERESIKSRKGQQFKFKKKKIKGKRKYYNLTKAFQDSHLKNFNSLYDMETYKYLNETQIMVQDLLTTKQNSKQNQNNNLMQPSKKLGVLILVGMVHYIQRIQTLLYGTLSQP